MPGVEGKPGSGKRLFTPRGVAHARARHFRSETMTKGGFREGAGKKKGAKHAPKYQRISKPSS